jgi:hypothetical protein
MILSPRIVAIIDRLVTPEKAAFFLASSANIFLDHDPDPKGRIGANRQPVFPCDKRKALGGDHAQREDGRRSDHVQT